MFGHHPIRHADLPQLQDIPGHSGQEKPEIQLKVQRKRALETSQYIKDLSNRWVTFDGQTVISCADHFCLKK